LPVKIRHWFIAKLGEQLEAERDAAQQSQQKAKRR